MTEIERIIKFCLANPWGEYYPPNENVRTVIAALEKRVPKKPEIKMQKEDLHIGRMIFKAGTKTYWCPSCKKTITGTDKDCRSCGQAIDWYMGGGDDADKANNKITSED